MNFNFVELNVILILIVNIFTSFLELWIVIKIFPKLCFIEIYFTHKIILLHLTSYTIDILQLLDYYLLSLFSLIKDDIRKVKLPCNSLVNQPIF